MPAKKLLIFPYNGNGVEALDCLQDGEYEFIGFIDDDKEKLARKNPHPVFDRNILEKHPDAFILAVPGSPASYTKRHEHIASLNVPDDRFITVVHPKASIGKSVTLGKNCLIMAGVVVTSNATVGDHVIILPNTVIHHDAKIGDYTLLGSNIAVAGSTVIGRNCYIGSGSNLINNITVSDYTLVGLGSNVIKSVPEQSKIAGNPARQIANKQ